MEERNFSAEESLTLIRQMIDRTRERMELQAGRHFLVMGYVTIAVTLGIWGAVCFTGNPAWHYGWFLIVAFYLLHGWHSGWFRPSRETRSHLDRITGYVWLAIALSGFMLMVTAFLFPIQILFIVLMLMGTGTAITGLVTRFTPLAVAGFVAALLLAPLTLCVEGINQLPIFAASFAVMMVIPGHLAARRIQKRKQS